MKLNEKEKNSLIKILKEQYTKNLEMLDDADCYWLKKDEERQKLIEHNEKIKEKYEFFESQQGELELELNLDNEQVNVNDKWVWALVLLVLVFGNFFDGDNSNK